MGKESKKGFVEWIKFNLGLLKQSFSSLSWHNLVSAMGDVTIVLVLFLAKSFSDFISTLVFVQTDLTNVGTSAFSGFLIRAFFTLLALGGILLTYVLGVLYYSLVNTYVWNKFLKRVFSFKKVLGVLWQSLVVVGTTLVLLYVIRLLLKDPIWQYVDFLLIVLMIIILPFMHIRFLQGKEKKVIPLVKNSAGFFFKNFKRLLLPGFFMLVIFNILVMSTTLLGFIPEQFLNFITMFVAFVVLSWIKQYLIVLVRAYEK